MSLLPPLAEPAPGTTRPPRAARPYLPRLLAYTAGYAALAALGLQWALWQGAVSPIWPAAGFAVAVLAMRGLRWWPFVPVGHVLAMAATGDTNGPLAQLALALGNGLGAVAAAAALRAIARHAHFEGRPTGIALPLALLAAGVGIAATVAATLGVATLVAAGTVPASSAPSAWSTWWLGDAAGVLVVAPLLYAWRRGAAPPPTTAQRWHLAACLLATTAAAWLVFASDWSPVLRTWHVLPFLIWAALAFALRGAAQAIAIAAGFAVHGAALGSGVFGLADASLAAALQYAQQYVLIVGTAMLVLAELADARRGEARLAASEERYRLALSAVQGHVYDLDVRAGRIERSPRLFELVGWRPGEVPPDADWWRERCDPDDYLRLQEHTRRAVESGAATVENRYRVRHRDGRWLWVRDRTALLRDRAGRVVRAVGSAVDVTAEVEATEALRAADRRKDEFLATLAHELRNPLAPIRHAARILDDARAGAAEQQWCRDVIRRQVGQMALLLDDLLDVSRITRGRLELKREPVTVRSFVDAAVETARPAIDARGHALRLRLPAADAVVDADPLRIAQVLANLLTNAAKYTDPGGTIELAAEAANGWLVLSVKDDGIGLAPDVLERIFEMFTQVPQARDRAQGGLGIGLGLVRGLVDLHGGTVEARSDGPGRGSEFVVRLPRTASAASEPPRRTGTS